MLRCRRKHALSRSVNVLRVDGHTVAERFYNTGAMSTILTVLNNPAQPKNWILIETDPWHVIGRVMSVMSRAYVYTRRNVTCVCVREKQRQRQRERERETATETEKRNGRVFRIPLQFEGLWLECDLLVCIFARWLTCFAFLPAS